MGTKVTRLLAFLLPVCFIAACTSSVDQASQRHTFKAQQWIALSDFAGDELKKAGLTITANITVATINGKQEFTMDRIKLSRLQEHSEIDLLSPEFFGKYICDEQCYFISQMISDDDGSKTNLSEFFYKNEGAFFSFYGELTLINERLSQLQSVDQRIYFAYLQSLLEKNQQFMNLEGFAKYLAHSVSESTYQTYLQNRIQQTTIIADTIGGLLKNSESQDGIFFSVLESEELGDEIPSDGLENIESGYSFPDDWETDNNAADVWLANRSTLNEMSLTEDDKIFLDAIEKSISNPMSSVTMQNTKEQLLKAPFSVGSTVCSISDNSFGTVKEINQNTVLVELIGEAKTLVDGLISRPNAGYLIENSEQFYFVNRNDMKRYASADVFTCNAKESWKTSGIGQP